MKAKFSHRALFSAIIPRKKFLLNISLQSSSCFITFIRQSEFSIMDLNLPFGLFISIPSWKISLFSSGKLLQNGSKGKYTFVILLSLINSIKIVFQQKNFIASFLSSLRFSCCSYFFYNSMASFSSSERVKSLAFYAAAIKYIYYLSIINNK